MQLPVRAFLGRDRRAGKDDLGRFVLRFQTPAVAGPETAFSRWLSFAFPAAAEIWLQHFVRALAIFASFPPNLSASYQLKVREGASLQSLESLDAWVAVSAAVGAAAVVLPQKKPTDPQHLHRQGLRYHPKRA